MSLSQPGLFVQSDDVTRQSQGNHNGVDHLGCLFARATLRLFDGDVLASFGFTAFAEGGVELNIQLTYGVVGDIQQDKILKPF